MAPCLNDLPEELLLLIIDAGSLKTMDGLSLRWTNRKFNAISSRLAFWLTIAQNSCSYIPVPVPLFCDQFNTLTVQELMAACISHHQTMHNLIQENPKYCQHGVLKVDGSSTVCTVSVLPGGKHAFILLLDNTLQLWSTRTLDTSISTASGTFPHIGKCLASWTYSGTLENDEYRILDGDQRTILVAALCRASEESETAQYSLTSFRFVDEDNVVVEERLSLDLQISPGEDRAVDLRGDLICGLYYGSDTMMKLVLMDRDESYDVLITDDGDLLLCCCTSSAMILQVYFNIPQILLTNSTVTHIDMPPDASGRVPYSSTWPEDYRWTTQLRQHTYRGQVQPRLVVCTSSSIFEDTPTDRNEPWRYAGHWFYPSEAIHHLKDPSLSVEYHRDGSCRIEREHDVGHEDEFYSGSAYRVLWIDEESGSSPDELGLHFHMLVSPSDDELGWCEGGPGGQVAIKGIFRVPLDVRHTTWLGFHDAASVLTLVTNNEGAGDLIHFFDY